jgi:hypothetical protein
VKFSAAMDGLGAVLQSESNRVSDAIGASLKDATDGLKTDLRQQTADVLGTRVSQTWRSRFYPNANDSRGPAGLVWSKAPRILDFWTADRVVTPLGAAFAIPVNPVIQRRGRKATIAEVERRFGKLEAVRLPSGNIGLFAVLGRGGSGRAARVKGRVARKGERVLMFVLVRTLRSRKLIDLDAAAARWAGRFADSLGSRLAAD